MPIPEYPNSRSLPSLRICSAMVLSIGLLVAGCQQGDAATKAAATPAKPKEIGVVTVKAERAVFQTELPGRTVSPLIAEIRPQVGGILQKRLFTEGSQVKEGQALYQLDAAPFQAAYASAQASVRRADATLGTARTVARRNAELVKIDAISQQVNDESQAAVLQSEAELAVARAAEQTARINLGYTRINSPIDGWVELSSVTPGALVTANQTVALTTVQQRDPVHVHVTQSSSELLRLKRELASGRLQRGDGNDARIRLLLEDGTPYPHDGRLTFSGVTVDAGTGSVTLRAVMPNPNGLLMPGMYVRAVLQEGVDDAALLLPQQAVTRAADGSASAMVVAADGKLAKRAVVVGRAVGNRWQVLDGLAVGDRVMVDGMQRARPGDVVQAIEVPMNAGQAAGQLAGQAAGNAPTPMPAGKAPGPIASAAPSSPR